MKVTLVHDWLIHMRGGEKVLETIAEIFPEETIDTLFYRRETLSPILQRMKIRSSFLQYLPGIRAFYRWLLPILPWVVETIRIDPDTDLVISSSHCVAKGVRIPKKAYHLCYCHTPMRYAWGFEDAYFDKMSSWLKPLLNVILSYLRRWDSKSSARVHQFIANSENVRQRIQNFYGRDAMVIHAPLDTDFFKKTQTEGDYYLVVSHFVPYKRTDLVIEAFNQLDRPLRIVGSGPLEKTYKQLPKNGKISFLGQVSDSELCALYSGARALIFPTEEDFGIVPLEAQACGTPVIAYAKGGSLETVQAGVFFYEQTAVAIRNSVLEFEKKKFDREKIPQLVNRFDKSQFKVRFQEAAVRAMAQGPAYVAC